MTGSVRRRNAVRGCRGVGTRPTRRRATPTDAGMRAQAEGSPRAVAAVAPRSRVGVFTTWCTARYVTYSSFYGLRSPKAIPNCTEVPCPRSPCRSQRRFRYHTTTLQILRPPDEQSPDLHASRDCASRMCVSRHARGPRPIAAGTVLDVTSYLSLPGRDPVPYACARRRGGRWFCAAPAAPCGPPRCPAIISRLICGTTACRVILNK